jgi:hypothetical protein
LILAAFHETAAENSSNFNTSQSATGPTGCFVVDFEGDGLPGHDWPEGQDQAQLAASLSDAFPRQAEIRSATSGLVQT